MRHQSPSGTTRRRDRALRCTVRRAVRVALLASLLSCDRVGDLLSVDAQSSIPADHLEESPANAQLLLNGAIADFDCAVGAYVVMGGLIGEELDEARQVADRQPYDQRTHTAKDRRYAVNGCVDLGVYTPLQTARASAERALWLLDRWTDAQVPNRATLAATASAYAGYSTLLLGEGFCTTVISSRDAGGAIVYGGEISRDSAFRVAESRFDRAIATAQAAGPGASAIAALALVGRARARLGRGDYVGARSDAVAVPAGFVRVVTASAATGRRQNRVWAQNSATSDPTSVGALYRSLNDPRVPVSDAHRKSVTQVPIFIQGKYPAADAPMRMASADEAQLIVAESDVAAADGASLAEARAILDRFRARGAQPAVAAGDSATLRAALIDQRRRELFLEGQHLGDVIRFEIALTPPAGTPFPAGGVYGSQKCLFLPDVERDNNPRLAGNRS